MGREVLSCGNMARPLRAAHQTLHPNGGHHLRSLGVRQAAMDQDIWGGSRESHSRNTVVLGLSQD